MKKTRKKFRYYDQTDRDRIEALPGAGHTQKEIAEILKVDSDPPEKRDIASVVGKMS